jgi:hypothetical protein
MALGWMVMGSPSAQVRAGTMTYVTPPGATTGVNQPVSDSATFTTGKGTITISLRDLQANPTADTQLLSDLRFTLRVGTTTGSSLSNSSGQEISVDKNGNYSLGSTKATGWAYSTPNSSTGYLDVLGTPVGPAHLLIGPPDGSNHYSKANGSIAGNKSHNPFLNQLATYIITAPNVTVNTTIASATFSFGTAQGAISLPGQPVQIAPESSSIVMMVLGVLGNLGLAGRHRFRRRSPLPSAA